MHGNSFTDLRRVIIEGSRGVGKRLKRQDEGCRTDLKKKLRARCSLRSRILGKGSAI